MSIVHSILENYKLPAIEEAEYLGGAGGFSGAQIWKIRTSGQSYCLRRWPPSHPDRQRLEWINLVLVHVSNNGCPEISVPINDKSGNRFLQRFNFFWELAPWMPGTADFDLEPNDNRLANAMDCLARFHLASAQVNLDFRPSPGIESRIRQLNDVPKSLSRIGRSAMGASDHGLPTSLFLLRDKVVSQGAQLARELHQQLSPFQKISVPVQPVIRDIWHDHVLFSGDVVTGLVDFGAMQMDMVDMDISRLLGSLIGNEVARWDGALDAYRSVRKLPIDFDCILALDRCAVLLGSTNWLNWLLVEDRKFESPESIDRRVTHLLNRI
ncbi:MAG: phosphotransferase enzyme family protein [Mariniblastus sp.]